MSVDEIQSRIDVVIRLVGTAGVWAALQAERTSRDAQCASEVVMMCAEGELRFLIEKIEFSEHAHLLLG